MKNSKTITNFIEVKSSEKAILISAILPEIGEEREFWLPKSKLEINGNNIELDETIYDSKVEELKNPVKEMLIIHSKNCTEGEKATKIILDAQLNEELNFELWVFLPNSKIISIEEISDRNFKVVIPEWLYESSIKSAKEKQLEFYNKDQEIYGLDDINIISKVERQKY